MASSNDGNDASGNDEDEKIKEDNDIYIPFLNNQILIAESQGASASHWVENLMKVYRVLTNDAARPNRIRLARDTVRQWYKAMSKNDQTAASSSQSAQNPSVGSGTAVAKGTPDAPDAASNNSSEGAFPEGQSLDASSQLPPIADDANHQQCSSNDGSVVVGQESNEPDGTSAAVSEPAESQTGFCTEPSSECAVGMEKDETRPPDPLPEDGANDVSIVSSNGSEDVIVNLPSREAVVQSVPGPLYSEDFQLLEPTDLVLKSDDQSTMPVAGDDGCSPAKETRNRRVPPMEPSSECAVGMEKDETRPPDPLPEDGANDVSIVSSNGSEDVIVNLPSREAVVQSVPGPLYSEDFQLLEPTDLVLKSDDQSTMPVAGEDGCSPTKERRNRKVPPMEFMVWKLIPVDVSEKQTFHSEGPSNAKCLDPRLARKPKSLGGGATAQSSGLNIGFDQLQGLISWTQAKIAVGQLPLKMDELNLAEQQNKADGPDGDQQAADQKADSSDSDCQMVGFYRDARPFHITHKDTTPVAPSALLPAIQAVSGHGSQESSSAANQKEVIDLEDEEEDTFLPKAPPLARRKIHERYEEFVKEHERKAKSEEERKARQQQLLQQQQQQQQQQQLQQQQQHQHFCNNYNPNPMFPRSGQCNPQPAACTCHCNVQVHQQHCQNYQHTMNGMLPAPPHYMRPPPPPFMRPSMRPLMQQPMLPPPPRLQVTPAPRFNPAMYAMPVNPMQRAAPQAPSAAVATTSTAANDGTKITYCLYCKHMGDPAGILAHYVNQHPDKDPPSRLLSPELEAALVQRPQAPGGGSGQEGPVHTGIRLLDDLSWIPAGSVFMMRQPCRYCNDYSTLVRSQLIQHVQAHREERLAQIPKPLADGTFRCRFCEHQTIDIDEFHDHCTVHTGEFMFACSYCSFRGQTYDDVRLHISQAHPGRALNIKTNARRKLNGTILYGYVCSECGFLQMAEKKVELHVKNTHPKQQAVVLTVDMSKKAPPPAPPEPPPLIQQQLQLMEPDAVAVGIAPPIAKQPAKRPPPVKVRGDPRTALWRSRQDALQTPQSPLPPRAATHAAANLVATQSRDPRFAQRKAATPLKRTTETPKSPSALLPPLPTTPLPGTLEELTDPDADTGSHSTGVVIKNEGSHYELLTTEYEETPVSPDQMDIAEPGDGASLELPKGEGAQSSGYDSDDSTATVEMNLEPAQTPSIKSEPTTAAVDADPPLTSDAGSAVSTATEHHGPIPSIADTISKLQAQLHKSPSSAATTTAIAVEDAPLSRSGAEGVAAPSADVPKPSTSATDAYPKDWAERQKVLVCSCLFVARCTEAFAKHRDLYHKGEKRVQCPECGAKLDSATAYAEHLAQSCPKAAARIFVCCATPLCGFVTSSKFLFTNHVQEEHQPDQWLPCYWCDKKYTTAECLAAHIQTQCVVRGLHVDDRPIPAPVPVIVPETRPESEVAVAEARPEPDTASSRLVYHLEQPLMALRPLHQQQPAIQLQSMQQQQPSMQLQSMQQPSMQLQSMQQQQQHPSMQLQLMQQQQQQPSMQQQQQQQPSMQLQSMQQQQQQPSMQLQSMQQQQQQPSMQLQSMQQQQQQQPSMQLQSMQQQQQPSMQLQSMQQRQQPSMQLQSMQQRQQPPMQLQSMQQRQQPPMQLQSMQQRQQPPMQLQSMQQRQQPPMQLQSMQPRTPMQLQSMQRQQQQQHRDGVGSGGSVPGRVLSQFLAPRPVTSNGSLLANTLIIGPIPYVPYVEPPRPPPPPSPMNLQITSVVSLNKPAAESILPTESGVISPTPSASPLQPILPTTGTPKVSTPAPSSPLTVPGVPKTPTPASSVSPPLSTTPNFSAVVQPPIPTSPIGMHTRPMMPLTFLLRHISLTSESLSTHKIDPQELREMFSAWLAAHRSFKGEIVVKPLPAHFARDVAAKLKSESALRAMLVESKLMHLYKCAGRDCDFSGDSEGEFREHLLRDGCRADNWLYCLYCGEKCKTVLGLVSHVTHHHGLSVFQCPWCVYRTKNPWFILLHLQVHHACAETASVLVCDRVASDVNSEEELPELLSLLPPVVCGVDGCEFISMDPDVCKSHHATAHPTLPEIPCFYCSQSVTPESFEEHLHRHQIYRIQCRRCGYGTVNVRDMVIHMCSMHPHRKGRCVIRNNPNPQVTAGAALGTAPRVPNATNPVPSVTEPLSTSNHDRPAPLITVKQEPMEEVPEATAVPEPETRPSPPVPAAAPVQPLPSKPLRTVAQPLPAPASRNDVAVPLPATSPSTFSSQPPLSDPPTSVEQPLLSPSPGTVVPPPATSPLVTASRSPSESLSSGQSLQPNPPSSLPGPIPPEAAPTAPKLAEVSANTSSDHLVEGSRFSCGYHRCRHGAPTIKALKEHLLMCPLKVDGALLRCPQCFMSLRDVASFLDHICSHQAALYFCGQCKYKAQLPYYVKTHMKEKHGLQSDQTRCVERIPDADSQPEMTEYIFQPVVQTLRIRFSPNAGTAVIANDGTSSGRGAQPLQHGLVVDDLESIPIQSIFPSEVKCARCNYATKVRSNLIRHMVEQHRSDSSGTGSNKVSGEPSTSAAPSSSWSATSSNEPTGARQTEQTANLHQLWHPKRVPEYVPSSRLYRCCIDGCSQLESSSATYQDHIQSVHPGALSWPCPHCGECFNEVSNFHMHISLHGPNLYKCPYCSCVNNKPYIISGHCLKEHPGVPGDPLVLRQENDRSGGGAAAVKRARTESRSQSSSTNDDDLPEAPELEDVQGFRCTVSGCTIKSHSMSVMRNHLVKHLDFEQLSCNLCPFTANKKSVIEYHFKVDHVNCPEPNYTVTIDPRHESVINELLESQAQALRKSKEQPALVASSSQADGGGRVIANGHVGADEDEMDDDDEQHNGDEGEEMTGIPCLICKYASPVENHLQKHIFKHLKRQVKKCGICRHTFTRPQDLHQHHDQVHSTQAFVVGKLMEGDVEQFVDWVVVLLKEYQKRHGDIRLHRPITLKCQRDGCQEKFSNLKLFSQHFRKHVVFRDDQNSMASDGEEEEGDSLTDAPTDVNTAVYMCPFCDYKGSILVKSKRHLLRHYDCKLFQCGYCSHDFLEETDVRQHCRQQHSDRPIKVNAREPMPNMSVRRVGGRPLFVIKERAIDKIGEKKFSCSECSYASVTMKSARHHCQNAHVPAMVIKLIPTTAAASATTAAPPSGITAGVIGLDQTGADQPIECTMCSEVLRDHAAFLEHFVKKHQGQQQQQNNGRKRRRGRLTKSLTLSSTSSPLSQPPQQTPPPPPPPPLGGTSTNAYRCRHCGYVCEALPVLKRHWHQKHVQLQFCYEQLTGVEVYECPYNKCTYNSSGLEEAKQHLKRHVHHFRCSYCRKTGATENVIKAHCMMKHVGQRPSATRNADFLFQYKRLCDALAARKKILPDRPEEATTNSSPPPDLPDLAEPHSPEIIILESDPINCTGQAPMDTDPSPSYVCSETHLQPLSVLYTPRSPSPQSLPDANSMTSPVDDSPASPIPSTPASPVPNAPENPALPLVSTPVSPDPTPDVPQPPPLQLQSPTSASIRQVARKSTSLPPQKQMDAKTLNCRAGIKRKAEPRPLCYGNKRPLTIEYPNGFTFYGSRPEPVDQKNLTVYTHFRGLQNTKTSAEHLGEVFNLYPHVIIQDVFDNSQPLSS